jgi:hypothetical protein
MQVIIYYTTLIRGEFGHEEYDTNIRFDVNADDETDAKKKAIKRLKTMEDNKKIFIFKINKVEVENDDC